MLVVALLGIAAPTAGAATQLGQVSPPFPLLRPSGNFVQLQTATIPDTVPPPGGVITGWSHMERGEVVVNPCDKLSMPRSDRRRDRIADPVEGAALINAVPVEDRPVWATAMYAGLRRGELRGLRARDVDLATGVIRVEYGWDDEEGAIELKSNAGHRRVPIAAVLRTNYLSTSCGSSARVISFSLASPEPTPSRTRRSNAEPTGHGRPAWNGSPSTSAVTPTRV